RTGFRDNCHPGRGTCYQTQKISIPSVSFFGCKRSPPKPKTINFVAWCPNPYSTGSGYAQRKPYRRYIRISSASWTESRGNHYRQVDPLPDSEPLPCQVSAKQSTKP